MSPSPVVNIMVTTVVRGPGVDEIIESLHYAYSSNARTVEFEVSPDARPREQIKFNAVITCVDHERAATGMYFLKFNIAGHPNFTRGEGFYNARDHVGELDISSTI